jgi:hypothetical protein
LSRIRSGVRQLGDTARCFHSWTPVSAITPS